MQLNETVNDSPAGDEARELIAIVPKEEGSQNGIVPQRANAPSSHKRKQTVRNDQAGVVTQSLDVIPPDGAGDYPHDATLLTSVPAPTTRKQGRGHDPLVPHFQDATPLPNGEQSPLSRVSLTPGALPNGEPGLPHSVTLDVTARLTSTIQTIVELWRVRQAWHRAEKSLTLQAKALLRRLCAGDKAEAEILYQAVTGEDPHALKEAGVFATLPLLMRRDEIGKDRKEIEKRLKQEAKILPGYDFVVKTPGLSEFTLYALVGECPGKNSAGLFDFSTVAKLWKRMGVAVMPDGQRQRKVMGDAAIAHGYNPSRRSLLWTIGDSLVKAKGPYRDLYLQYKAEEKAKAEAKGLTVAPSAKIPKKTAEQYMAEGVIHRRAKRHMEKTLLRDLWVEWRRATFTL